MDNMTIPDPTEHEIDNILEKYKSVGLAVGGMVITDGVITLSDLIDTYGM